MKNQGSYPLLSYYCICRIIKTKINSLIAHRIFEWKGSNKLKEYGKHRNWKGNEVWPLSSDGKIMAVQ